MSREELIRGRPDDYLPFWSCPWLHISEWIRAGHGSALRFHCWRCRLSWHVAGLDPELRALRRRVREAREREAREGVCE